MERKLEYLGDGKGSLEYLGDVKGRLEYLESGVRVPGRGGLEYLESELRGFVFCFLVTKRNRNVWKWVGLEYQVKRWYQYQGE